MRCRHAGTAIKDGLRCLAPLQQHLEFLSEYFFWQKETIRANIRCVKEVYRPGNMPRDRVYRLYLAAIALRGTGIYEEKGRILQVLLDEVAVPRHIRV